MKPAFKFLTSILLLLGGWLSLVCAVAVAQQSEKVPRIAFLTSFGRPSMHQFDAFREGLKELGYVEGKNIAVDYYSPKSGPESAPDLVTEVLKRKVDLFVASDPTAIRAIKQATKTVPIVMLTNQDPVATGLIESLARPGGNITGITRLTRELSGKRLELLKEVLPRVTRIGILWVRPTALGTGNAFQNYEAAAKGLKVQLQSLQVSRPNPDIDGAFQAASAAQINAIIIVSHAALGPYSKRIAEVANRNRLTSMCEAPQYADAGCVMTYATNDVESFRRAAYFVDKILKGTKPADLPVEQATKFEFIINLKSAKQIRLDIPQSVLFRADRVIR